MVNIYTYCNTKQDFISYLSSTVTNEWVLEVIKDGSKRQELWGLEDATFTIPYELRAQSLLSQVQVSGPYSNK